MIILKKILVITDDELSKLRKYQDSLTPRGRHALKFYERLSRLIRTEIAQEEQLGTE